MYTTCDLCNFSELRKVDNCNFQRIFFFSFPLTFTCFDEFAIREYDISLCYQNKLCDLVEMQFQCLILDVFIHSNPGTSSLVKI